MHYIVVIFTFLIAVIAYLAYRYLIQPRKLMDHYEKVFKQKGYKTVKMPFKPLSTPFYD
jgi:uncharacterized membrane protein SpoIIM required for sporulation